MGKASRLFNGTAEQTLIGKITPSLDQREFLQQQWNALADHLKATLVSHGYPISTWVQGSYKYGTLIKPVHIDEEYDVDVGVYFEWEPEAGGAEPTPRQLRDWVQDELVRHASTNDEIESIEIPPKERCSRAVYGRQFHIDTPTYHLNPTDDLRRLARLSGPWEASDPKAFYKWFRDVVTGPDREQLRRLIRYMKGWAAVAFEGAAGARPSSILLTVVVTEAYLEMGALRETGVADDDALLEVVLRMSARLHRSRRVANPVAVAEDLNRIPADSWDAFLRHADALKDAGEDARDAENEAGAALAWSVPFSYLMPLPEVDELEVSEDSGERALMVVPDVLIQVFARSPRRLVATYTNEVPLVEVNHDLEFSISNRQLVPDHARIEWTVRNEGTQADYIGDLGHAKGDVNAFEVKERTEYLGRHHMDCVIRHNGSVYALRRIPVLIAAKRVAGYAPPTQRSYLKLRTRKGKRR